MQLDDYAKNQAFPLIGHSVFDCHGYLLGPVNSVKERPEGDFALVVEFPVSKDSNDDLIIENSSLTKIDNENQTIHTDLDFARVVPQNGKTVSLVEERLTMNRHRHKIGEVVVRKVRETNWVRIPVHREKLVVQTVGKPEPLTEVTLGQTKLPLGVEFVSETDRDGDRSPKVLGTWPTIDDAFTAINRLATDPSSARDSLTILLSMRENHSADPITMTFPSSRMAAQLLPTLAHSLGAQCQEIRLVR